MHCTVGSISLSNSLINLLSTCLSTNTANRLRRHPSKTTHSLWRSLSSRTTTLAPRERSTSSRSREATLCRGSSSGQVSRDDDTPLSLQKLRFFYGSIYDSCFSFVQATILLHVSGRFTWSHSRLCTMMTCIPAAFYHPSLRLISNLSPRSRKRRDPRMESPEQLFCGARLLVTTRRKSLFCY